VWQMQTRAIAMFSEFLNLKQCEGTIIQSKCRQCPSFIFLVRSEENFFAELDSLVDSSCFNNMDDNLQQCLRYVCGF
jgi:hypothetical protein